VEYGELYLTCRATDRSVYALTWSVELSQEVILHVLDLTSLNTMSKSSHNVDKKVIIDLLFFYFLCYDCIQADI